MKREELLQRANCWAERRNYTTRLTSRTLSDWVSEGLVSGPTSLPHPGQRPASRNWSIAAYRQVLGVMLGMHQGLDRFDALRVVLWLRGGSEISERVRLSMQAEARRVYKQAFRPLRGDPGTPRDRPLRAVENREPDPRLAPVANIFSPGIKTAVYDAMRWGEPFPMERVLHDLHAYFGVPPPENIANSLPNFSLQGAGQYSEDATDGVIEGSIESSLQNASNSSFRDARRFARKLRRAIRNVGPVFRLNPFDTPDIVDAFISSDESLYHYPWNFIIFSFVLHGMADGSGDNQF